MTVSSKETRVVHRTDNQVESYAFPFKALKPEHLSLVVVDPGAGRTTALVYGPDYGVTGLDADSGGQVRLSAAGRLKAGSGRNLVISRSMPFTQEADFTQEGILRMETLERSLDLAAMERQELMDKLGRTLQLPPDQNEPFESQDVTREVERAAAAAEAAGQARAAAEAEAGRCEALADQSGQSAGQAAEAVRQAVEIVGGIEGFAHNVHNFLGLRVEGFTLYQDRTENGDHIRAEDYGFMNLLPILAEFKLRDGALILEQPLAA